MLGLSGVRQVTPDNLFVGEEEYERMAPMKVEQYVVGMVQTNCYFVINEDTKETLVVDPGGNADKLIEIAEAKQLLPVAILLTHGHFDHASGAREMAEHFGIKIYAQEYERETLEEPALNLSHWEGTGRKCAYHADYFLKDEQEIDLAGFHIRVFHTPGHTVGGCCYYFPYHAVVFSGDTLFCGSVGRSDFEKGNAADLIRGIREKLMTLPDEVTVYPGHNEITDIGRERMYNPYL